MIDKNILFLTHSYTSFVKDQIEIIAQYFRHVYVLVRYKPVAEISRIIPFHYLKQHRKDFVFQLKGKPENVTVIPVPLYYLPTKKGYAGLGEGHFRKVRKIIHDYKISFDIIHSHFIWTSGYVGAKLKEGFNKRLVITSHRNNNRFIEEIESKNPLYLWTIKQADTIIRVNENTLPYLKQYNKNAVCLKNGFHSALFYKKNKNECRRKLRLPVKSKIILTVGFLVEQKGQQYLIKSMKDVVAKEKNVLCLIVGEGKLYKKLQRQINKLGIQAHVKLIGGKLHHEIPNWVNACDLFVLPSLSESFGIVQIEAMACGKPVVATINGGSEDVIKSDDVGLLCEKANPKDLSEKILAGLNKKWDEEKILRYAKQYRWEDICLKILNIYKNGVLGNERYTV